MTYDDSLFGGTGNWKVFDAYDYYIGDRHNGKSNRIARGYSELGSFGITTWYTENASVNTKCKVVNFLKIESEENDRNAMIEIVSDCIALSILPEMSEIMQMETVPSEWIVGRINRLSDFYTRFHVVDTPIHDIVQFFDNHLNVSEEEKVLIRVTSSGSNDSVYGEKNLYQTLRDNVDLASLKCFKIEFAIYLSELVDDDSIDANAIVRKILEMEKANKKKYNYLIYDVTNLLNTNNNADVAATVVVTAAKRGIVVDFSKDSIDFETHVYNKIYRKIYNFNSAREFTESLRQIYDTYGPEFYLSDKFRKYYPVKLLYINNAFGEEEIFIEDNSKSENDLSLDTFDPMGSKELIKINSTSYKVIPSLLIGANCPYRLVSSAYVLEDESIDIKDRPKLLFLG